MRETRTPWPQRVGLILFAVATVAIFFPSLLHSWLEIEDGDYFLHNPLLQDGPLLPRLAAAWSTSPADNWIPGTWTLVIVLHEFFGFKAGLFHGLSLAIHLANAYLILRLARTLSGHALTAWFACALFTFHPTQVESVVWASSLKGLLSTCFVLLNLTVLSKPGRIAYLAAVALFTVAVLCKQDVVAYPLILLVLRPVLFPELRLKSLVPFFLCAVAASIAALLVNQASVNPATPTALLDLLGRPVAALGHYMTHWLAPHHLHPDYRFDLHFTAWSVTFGSLTLIFAALCVKWFTPQNPAPALFISGLLALSPVLGWFANPLEFASDRLGYFPWAFLSISVALGLSALLKKPGHIAVTGLAMSSFLAVLTTRQIPLWSSDLSLCTTTLERDPDHYLARVNLGLYHARLGEFPPALQHLEMASAQHPERLPTWTEQAKVLMMQGRAEEAISLADEGLTHHPGSPDLLQLQDEFRAFSR